MIKIRKYLISFVMCILIAISVLGCEKKSNISSEDKQVVQEIVVAVSSDTEINQLDAADYKGLMQAYPLMYDSLVEYGEKGKIIPGLAEKWEISPDGKSYIFYLKKGVEFSDGTPFNAKAVKFSVQRWANKPQHSWLNISKNLEKIKIIDEYTIKLSFNTGYYRTLTELTYPRPLRIMSPTSVEPMGDPNGKFVKPIGTGPWKVEKYTKDKQTTFVKNNNYWGEKPKVDKLVFKVIPDPQTRVLALQSGEIDLSGGQMGTIPMESLNLLKKNSELKVLSTEGTTSYFLIFNDKNKIFNDNKVRKAINYATNKKEIVKNLFDKIGNPAKGLFQPTVPYVTKDNNKGYECNIEKAKKLLQEAGWKDNDGDNILDKDGKEMKLSFALQVEEYPEWKSMCEVIQSDLAKVGISVELKIFEKAAYYDELWKNKNCDLIVYRTYSDAWNPYGSLTSLFHTTDKGTSVAYASKDLDTLIDNISNASNATERQKVYDEIFQLMYNEAVCVPIYYADEVFVTNTNIKKFKFGITTYNPVIWEKLEKTN